jgi:hypothetical protein
MFRPDQIRNEQPAKLQPNSPAEYDPALDDELAGMFGRKWGEEEQFTPQAKKLYHALNWTCLLGNFPEFDDIPLFLSLAKNTASNLLRQKACSCLRSYLTDCSGTNASLKPAAKALLESIGSPVQKMDN